MSPITAAEAGRPAGSGHVAAAVGGDRLGRERQRRRELRPGATGPPPTRVTGPAARVEGAGDCQSRITTAEMLFFGEPSTSLSE